MLLLVREVLGVESVLGLDILCIKGEDPLFCSMPFDALYIARLLCAFVSIRIHPIQITLPVK